MESNRRGLGGERERERDRQTQRETDRERTKPKNTTTKNTIINIWCPFYRAKSIGH